MSTGFPHFVIPPRPSFVVAQLVATPSGVLRPVAERFKLSPSKSVANQINDREMT